jgi:hypothetical protein
MVDGTIKRFKVRLVAEGLGQIYRLDDNKTITLIVRMDTLQGLLTIIALDDLECRQIDIKNAFTESELREKTLTCYHMVSKSHQNMNYKVYIVFMA